MSHIFHIAPYHYFIFLVFWMVDHWLSLAHVYKNKWQSRFTKCVTINYSTFNNMKFRLQIKLKVDFFLVTRMFIF